MKILMLTDSLRGGGKERRMLELIKALKSAGDFKIEIITMSSEVGYQEFIGLKIPIHQIVRRIRWDPSVFFRMNRVCLAFKPDIIHAWDQMTAFYAAPLAKICKAAFVNGMITIAPAKISRLSTKWLFSRASVALADVIVANSWAGLRSFRAPRSKSIVIRNGFDFHRITELQVPKNVRERLGVVTPLVVGMVASFTRYKDFQTLIQSARIILEKRRDVTFLLVGDGPLKESCKELVPPDLDKNVLFLGHQRDVESIVNIFTVGVLSTNANVHGEGISNSILEYMALAKPVVASDTGGTSEIVIHGETGYIVKPNDSASLAARIEHLLNNPDLTIRMGRRGRERIEDDFGIQKMVAEFIDLYERVKHSDQVTRTVKKSPYLFITEELDAPFDEGVKLFTHSLISRFANRFPNAVSAVVTRGNPTINAVINFMPTNGSFLSARLREFIVKHDPDIIVYIPASSATFFSFVRSAVLWKYFRNAKIVMIALQSRAHTAIEKFFISRILKPNLLFVQSEESVRYYQKIGVRVSLLSSGVDVSKFQPASIAQKLLLREKFGVSSNSFVVLHVGHLNKGRNIEALVQVQKQAGIQVVIVGSTSTVQDKNLSNKLKENGIKIVTNFVQNINEYYQMADCYVFPIWSARSAIEMPLSVLEAIACGIPVISTPFGGLMRLFPNVPYITFIQNESEIAPEIHRLRNADVKRFVPPIDKLSWEFVVDSFLEEINYQFGIKTPI